MLSLSLSLPLSLSLSVVEGWTLLPLTRFWQNRRPQWLSTLLYISECILINLHHPFKWALLDLPTARSDKQSMTAYISL